MVSRKLASNLPLTSFSIKKPFPVEWMIRWSCMEWPSGCKDMIAVVGMHHLPAKISPRTEPKWASGSYKHRPVRRPCANMFKT